MEIMYDLAVYIGRFQPFHNGHAHVVNEGLKIAKKVLILIGSANASRSAKNPFTAEERAQLILGATDSKVEIDYLNDYTYEENQWVTEVQDLVLNYTSVDSKVCILGHEKDESSYYLREFPQWKFESANYFKVINSTHIRELMYEGKDVFVEGAVDIRVMEQLIKWTETEEYLSCKEEYEFILEYRKSWATAPYAPTFVTADAVVIQSGHILLIQRQFNPGKGIWAIPGGFVDNGETIREAALRELKEETKLKVPLKVLEGSIQKSRVFDSPSRSGRGRTITTAFLIQLDSSMDLPRVYGSDDATRAKWVTLSEFYDMPTQMFEDHYHIIRKLLDNM